MKTQAEKSKNIKLILTGLAEYYNKELSDNQIVMYAEDLMDLEIEMIIEAIGKIRKNPSQVFFPMPAQIRESVLGSVKEKAIEASNRVIEAMARCGWNNPESARIYMGDIAWEIVRREGGWTSLCERTKSEDLPILKAQWRELAVVIINRGESKTFDRTAIGNVEILKLAQSATKTVPKS